MNPAKRIPIILDDEVIRVSAIMEDSQGLYYMKKPSIYWKCRKCGFSDNPAWANYCKKCGKHYNS